MKLEIDSRVTLTTESSQSSYGIPVLETIDGTILGKNDRHPDVSFQRAGLYVKKSAELQNFQGKELEFCEKFYK